MKTTIDLPDDLLRQLKLRAVQDRRKLRELAAELLRTGLAAPSNSESPGQTAVLKDKKTGLPVIQCRRAPAPNRQPTPGQIADLLTAQEIAWAHESS